MPLRKVRDFYRATSWRVRNARNWGADYAKAPEAGDGRLLVNLGCGKVSAMNYVNVDLTPYPHVHYLHEVNRLPFLGTGTVDLLYASHILEHFSNAEAKAALLEWRRVLKPGGVLRLGVPDFSVIVAAYQASGDLEALIGPLMGGQEDPKNFHLSVYDEGRLTDLLVAAGFSHVEAWDPATAADHEFTDTTALKWLVGGIEYPISLNLQARK